MSCCAIRLVDQNRQIYEVTPCSADVPKIATGVFATLAAYPAIHYCIEKVCDAMTYFNFDLTEKQEAIQILDWIFEVGSTFAKTALLASFIFYVVILGPLLEEALFRGGFNVWMKNKMEGWGYDVMNNSLHKALYWTICGTFFGAAHLSPTQGWTNLPIFIGTSLMGIFFSSLKDEASNDLTAPSVAHMLNNGISVTRLLLKA